MTPETVKPASKVTPSAIPTFKNKGREKRIAPAANAERQKSFPANKLAAYSGYVMLM
tara:strand:- start:668 stop:838 length:171 start_codon:yes stop_codon:yes gene_type:complete